MLLYPKRLRVRVRVSCWISFFACNYFTSYRKSSINPLGGLIYFQQQQQHLSREPNDCFLWNICLEKQKLPRIFYSLTVPFVYNFRSLSNKFDFLKFNFSHFTYQVKLFFVEKGNLKFSEPKMRCREESQKKYHFRKTLNCSWNFPENKMCFQCI